MSVVPLRKRGIWISHQISDKGVYPGWQSIIRYEGHVDDVAICHEPGEGYRWEPTLAREGFTRLREDREYEVGPDYYVCDSLEPGTYRFLYVGIDVRRATDFALGVQFTVTPD